MANRVRFPRPLGRQRLARRTRNASPARRRRRSRCVPALFAPRRMLPRPASEVRKRPCALRLVRCAIRRGQDPIRARISHFVTSRYRRLRESAARDRLARVGRSLTSNAPFASPTTNRKPFLHDTPSSIMSGFGPRGACRQNVPGKRSTSSRGRSSIVNKTIPEAPLGGYFTVKGEES